MFSKLNRHSLSLGGIMHDMINLGYDGVQDHPVWSKLQALSVPEELEQHYLHHIEDIRGEDADQVLQWLDECNQLIPTLEELEDPNHAWAWFHYNHAGNYNNKLGHAKAFVELITSCKSETLSKDQLYFATRATDDKPTQYVEEPMGGDLLQFALEHLPKLTEAQLEGSWENDIYESSFWDKIKNPPYGTIYDDPVDIETLDAEQRYLDKLNAVRDRLDAEERDGYHDQQTREDQEELSNYYAANPHSY